MGWVRLLRELGSAPESAVLPAVVACPVCRDRAMTVYRDRLLRGEWFHCRACGTAGDAIELYAACRFPSPGPVDIDAVEAAIGRLTERGLMGNGEPDAPTVAAYWRTVAGPRRRAAALVARGAAAAEAEAAAGTLAGLLARLGVGRSQSGGRWAERVGRFVFVVRRRDVEDACCPGTAEVNSNAGLGRVFKGLGWGTHVLVHPFHDLPGRIRGFVIAGRSGGDPGDVFYRAVHTNYDHSPRAYMPASDETTGVSFLDALPPGTDPALGPTVFALFGSLRALQLQETWLRQAADPLPAVGVPDTAGGRRVVLDPAVVAGRPVVVWAPAVDRRVLAFAARLDARIAAGGEDADFFHDAARLDPRQWLARQERKARPWRDVMADMAAGYDAPAVADLEAYIGLRPGQDCAPPPAPGAAAPVPARTAVVRGMTVEEADGRWYRTKRHARADVVADAVVRVDVIRRYGAGDRYAAGAVLFNGAEYLFTEKLRVLETAGFRWVQDFLLDAGAGYMRYVDEFAGDMMAIATQFRRPAVDRGAGGVGWDPGLPGWAFPGFTVRPDGTAGPDAFPPGALPVVDPPAPPTPAECAALAADTPTARAAWALAAAVVANAAAPALLRETTGFLVAEDWDGGASAMTLLRWMGCRHYPAVTDDPDVAGRLDRLDTCDPYPAAFRWDGSRPDEVGRWVDAAGRRQSFLLAPPAAAAAMPAGRGWLRLAVGPVRPAAVESAVRRVVPTALAWLAAAGWPPAAGRWGPAAVGAALADWFRPLGGDSPAAAAAAAWEECGDPALSPAKSGG